MIKVPQVNHEMSVGDIRGINSEYCDETIFVCLLKEWEESAYVVCIIHNEPLLATEKDLVLDLEDSPTFAMAIFPWLVGTLNIEKFLKPSLHIGTIDESFIAPIFNLGLPFGNFELPDGLAIHHPEYPIPWTFHTRAYMDKIVTALFNMSSESFEIWEEQL
jgi:hypothetical protein